MGASHTTLSAGGGHHHHSSATNNELEWMTNQPELMIEDSIQLKTQYDIDQHLFPGSGRMMKTYRLKHKLNSSMAVMKCMWVSKEYEIIVTKQQDELRRIKDVLLLTTTKSKNEQQQRHHHHIAPFLYWTCGNYKQKTNNIQIRPVAIIRTHTYTTLSDRLASRPFLTHVEKLWITTQLLETLDYIHTKNIVHGFLTTENIGLTSWNWVVLLDIASYKSRTSLPDDDPSEYLYYFQEIFSTNIRGDGKTNTTTTSSATAAATTSRGGGGGGGGEKRCYLAPERFYTPKHHHNVNSSNDHHDDHHHHEDGGDDDDHNNNKDKNNNDNNSNNDSSNNNNDQSTTKTKNPPLVPSMDIFSAGCVIMETFLNGERALDLGDLMEYRKNKKFPQLLVQKLNKIEFSAIRAACRHMLSINPSERLSAKSYLERLKAAVPTATTTTTTMTTPSSSTTTTTTTENKSNIFVPVDAFKEINIMMERCVTCSSPDARLAIAATSYSSILWTSQGIVDEESNIYFEKILGPTMTSLEEEEEAMNKKTKNQTSVSSSIINEEEEDSSSATALVQPQHNIEEKKEEKIYLSDDDIFAETEALLRQLEALNFDNNNDDDMGLISSGGGNRQESTPESSSNNASSKTTTKNSTVPREKRSQLSQSSLLIYLQLVLSTVRHVLRPASKLVALQLIQRVGKFTTDEARLQRIIPVTVFLLQDQDPLVRASAIHVLTSMVSKINSFPPSDSKVFPQYIFKRVGHMITDPALVVRLAFARNVALLAETAHRFLDISHAVRLYEAVGGGGTTNPSSSIGGVQDSNETSKNVFTDDVAKLLDDPSATTSGGLRGRGGNSKFKRAESSGVDSTTGGTSSGENNAVVGNGRTLISSNYHAELSALHETVSRWVVQITSDSSPAKRALLGDLARLCNFFGLDGVMAFILPQILSFLNDRKDWQLRAALFENLPSLCHIIGRAATEHFVLPCLETALVDGEEAVISSALQCLSELLQMGLLSRSLHLGGDDSESSPGLLKKYAPLLVHPSADIRLNFIAAVNAVCRSLGSPDDEVFVVPILRPFLRFQPSSRHLETREGMEMCLHSPWTRKRFQAELDKLIAYNNSSLSPTSGQWTAIAFQIHDDDDEKRRQDDDPNLHGHQGNMDGATSKNDILDSQSEQVRSYLQMLAKRRSTPLKGESDLHRAKNELNNAIEGSLKLAQQIKFPRQVTAGISSATLPPWYGTLREAQEKNGGPASEATAIRSVSALGQIYGLSIMDQSAATSSASADTTMTTDLATSILQSEESKRIQAACAGEWGSETCLDPTLTDTSLLVTKLNALQVPPLPPKLAADGPIYSKRGGAPVKASPRDGGSVEWKPKIDTMVASSRSAPGFGHTAPVVRLVISNDQRFFVTGSYDSTCRVWELEKAEHSNGVLESSITYTGHSSDGAGGGGARVNDLAMVEGGHSVISGASDGSVQVWRVDMVSSSLQSGSSPSDAREMARVAGSSIIRKAQVDEGEILAVNHFNTSAASIMTYATQRGFIHSWDLRCANEPFVLNNPLDTGYITSMAMGSDRNWMVTGTSKGCIALWDIRFQQIIKLWRHNRSLPVKRLATSFVPAPQSWTGKPSPSADPRPFVFAACGPNECSMLDLTDGSCRACFRTIDYGRRYSRSDLQDVPRLHEIPLSNSARRRALAFQNENSQLKDVMLSSFLSVNAMVGSIGASDHSFLITGGSDCKIRFWDFAVPSKCYNVGGSDGVQPRFSFDRIGPNQSCRLMLCRQPPNAPTSEVESSKAPRKLMQGLARPEASHQDSIQDLKVVRSGLLSCSRDCTVKLWR